MQTCLKTLKFVKTENLAFDNLSKIPGILETLNIKIEL